jgi:GrpB-like predicted nucleotidyltransferase (UPF0157 family)
VSRAADPDPLPALEALNGPVVLANYDPDWPAWYDTLAARVRAALGERVVALHHAGSTSVPGLAAKPLIDMLLEVADSADEAAYVPDLEAADFVLRIREPDWFEHRLLKSAAPPANLHVYTAGEEEVRRMLAFRDHLSRDGADRALYEATKRTLAARTWEKTQDYADAKSAVVAEIMSRALAWP